MRQSGYTVNEEVLVGIMLDNLQLFVNGAAKERPETLILSILHILCC